MDQDAAKGRRECADSSANETYDSSADASSSSCVLACFPLFTLVFSSPCIPHLLQIFPRSQEPSTNFPVGRAGHSSVYSETCSVGSEVERGSTAAVADKLVYPGIFLQSPWCRGQVVIYGERREVKVKETL
eukprot:768081-Hanusia_phi.AAC.3